MNFVGQYCLVRTFTAGVHMGTLAECAGTAVVLKDARRLWRWRGANSLHEVALAGVAAGSRISQAVPVILLTQATEVIPCADKARKSLDADRWDS